MNGILGSIFQNVYRWIRITGGTIDNTPIGSTTPSTGAFTTLKMTTGAGASKVATSDGSGNMSWQTAPTGTVPSSGTTVGSMMEGDGATGWTTVSALHQRQTPNSFEIIAY